MKKLSTVAVVAAITAILLSGCFGGRSDPTEMPGNSATAAPTTEMTLPTMPDILPDMTDGMDTTEGTNGMDATSGTDATASTEATTDATDVIDPPASRSRVN